MESRESVIDDTNIDEYEDNLIGILKSHIKTGSVRKIRNYISPRFKSVNSWITLELVT